MTALRAGRGSVGPFVAAGLILVGSLVAWFLTTHERVTEEIDVGFQGRARVNRALALERFLTASGIPATTLPGALELPKDHAGVLFLFVDREAWGPARVSEVLEWVRSGGHLVAGPSRQERDALLEILGVSVRNRPVEEKESPDGSKEALPGIRKAGRPRSTARTKLEAYGDALSLQLESPLRFAAGRTVADVAAPDRDHAVVLSLPYGSGRVTLLTEPEILWNDLLDQASHARLAWHLAVGPGNEDEDEENGTWPEYAVIALRDRTPSLLALLWRYGWAFLSTFAVALAAFLFRRGARFGPVLAERPAERRSLLEHVDAAGAYLYRRGEWGALLEGPRASVAARLLAREPALLQRSARERVTRLAVLSRLPGSRIERALDGEDPASAEDLVQTIQTLETLRRSL